MRVFLIITVIATLFFSMTGLVYYEGCFEGALAVKPYPIYGAAFGGGESGAWARHHSGQPLPWFMQKDVKVISEFSWEEGGDPGWVTAYMLGFLVTLLAWITLAFIGAVRLIRALAKRDRSNLSIKADA